jgi:uncharacterized protein (DUF1800 family)
MGQNKEVHMSNQDLELMAHLMRRAAFGATRDELEQYLSMGYEATVEELLNPPESATRSIPDDILRRFHTSMGEMRNVNACASHWLYRMINTSCPLEEKLTLFWHGLFATGNNKTNQAKSLLNQADTFRKHGFGPFSTMLVELSRDPAMLMWLDNNDNHTGTINENYGRELLELFSMGIGNYTEQDIKECARAFTGWTLGNAEYLVTRANKASIWPYSRIAWHFEYREYDHDDGVKTFLGEQGRFNGEDIIDIIARQESTAHFICTRLFQYFAADEVDQEGEQVIQDMANAYFESKYEIRSVLRTLFNSDYFKSEKAHFARVKGPVELVVGALRQAGTYRTPTLGVEQLTQYTMYMGQQIFQPPSVEGWHEGVEWIDSGTLVERVNFVGKELGNVKNPGIRRILDRLALESGGTFSPEELVDHCLHLLGPVPVGEDTREALVEYASRGGVLHLEGHQPGDESEQRVGDLLRLVASTREFQLA